MSLQRGYLDNPGWLWALLAMSTAAIVAFALHAPLGGRDGSSIVGYGLGGISALMVVYLAWLGLRKRRFSAGRARLRDAVSAHVYTGLALIVTATLHTGFEFTWSLHTLAYALLMLVALSGVFGTYVYAVMPGRLSRNLEELLREETRFDLSGREQLEAELGEIDRRLERALQVLPDTFRKPLRQSIEATRLGGGVWRIISGSSRGCATAAAVVAVRDIVGRGHFTTEERRRISEVVHDLARKREIAAGLRRDGRFRALLQIWLWLHIPLTAALLISMVGHIVLVFFYW